MYVTDRLTHTNNNNNNNNVYTTDPYIHDTSYTREQIQNRVLNATTKCEEKIYD